MVRDRKQSAPSVLRTIRGAEGEVEQLSVVVNVYHIFYPYPFVRFWDGHTTSTSVAIGLAWPIPKTACCVFSAVNICPYPVFAM